MFNFCDINSDSKGLSAEKIVWSFKKTRAITHPMSVPENHQTYVPCFRRTFNVVVLLTMEQQRIALLSNTAHKTKATTNHLICSRQEIANLVRLRYCKPVDLLPNNFLPHNSLRRSVQYHINFTGKYSSPSHNYLQISVL